MYKKIASYLSAVALAAILTACATPGQQSGEVEVRAGVIDQISYVELRSDRPAGVGAIIGGLGGLAVGSLIGGGTGRDVAMVAGAVGGAYAGNEIQKKNDQPVQGQQIVVRTSDGMLVSVTQPVNPSLRHGEKVFIQGNGENARVVPR